MGKLFGGVRRVTRARFGHGRGSAGHASGRSADAGHPERVALAGAVGCAGR